MTKLPRRLGKGQIRSQGKVVWSVEWDWGGPGEAGADEVYQLDGSYYYVAEDGELYGPYPTLAETVAETGLNAVSRATRSVNSSAFSASEVAALLVPLEENQKHGLAVRINGETWVWVESAVHSDHPDMQADAGRGPQASFFSLEERSEIMTLGEPPGLSRRG